MSCCQGEISFERLVRYDLPAGIGFLGLQPDEVQGKD
jgi:hypothetical protein